MSTIDHLVITEELDFSALENAAKEGTSFILDYDAAEDTAYVYFVERVDDVVVHYMDDYIGLIYDPSTLAVLGLQIEAFAYSFIPAHNLSETWDLNDADRKALRNTGELVQASERKMKAMTKELERIAVDPLIGGGKNRKLALA